MASTNGIRVFVVCVNAAGCLPDSEIYPYEVEGVTEAIDVLHDELMHLGTQGDDISQEQYEQLLSDAIESLRANGYAHVPLDGTYALHITEKR